FAEVAAALADAPEGERRRWQALAAARAGYLETLAGTGRVDPHAVRLEALAAGRLRPPRAVVLAGVTDPPGLARRVLAAAAAPTVALVFAPAARRADFDGLGAVRIEAWEDPAAVLPLDRAELRLAEDPPGQAAAAVEALRALSGRARPEEVTIGVADEEVTPFCTAALAAEGIEARDAAGRPAAASGPIRLLGGLGRFLAERRFPALAALARHPDLEPALRRLGGDQRLGGASLPEALDDWAERSFPHRVGTEAPAPAAAWIRALLDLAGPLAAPRPRPLPELAEAVAGLLEAVYGPRRYRSDEPAERTEAGALAACADVLEEWLELPPELAAARPAAPAAALELVAAEAGRSRIPPPAGDAAIELLGWLELALDDAPFLILTGFQDGRVPEPVAADPFLPDALRRRLGLPDRGRRLARDAAALEAILRSRVHCTLVSGRRDLQGEPLRPSRLLFFRPAEELPARVLEVFAAGGDASPASPAPPADEGGRVAVWPLPAPPAPPDHLRVTDFAFYLGSPRRFLFERVLGLRPVDDDRPELDPAAFGSLAHRAVEVLAEDSLRSCTDGDRIFAALDAALTEAALARFGREPAPAVRLQLGRLRARLRRFAAWQAEHAAAGWEIVRVEADLPEDAALVVDDEPMPIRGRIDRIDRHRDGRWLLLDYKTTDRAKKPEAVHRRGEEWIDLQLPLYGHFAAGLGVRGEPGLGFLALAASGDPPLLRAEWSREDLQDALAAAAEVVRRIRRGDFEETGRTRFLDPVLAGLLDAGLLGGAVEDEA
ncbi:MAG: PD-(D/E)XK nuclease family protein, partial [Planctomycetota bacterium]